MEAIHVSGKDFKQLLQEEKPVLVDFWASWCGYCRKISPALDKIAGEYKDRLVIAKINIEHDPQLARQEEIEVLPTLVLYKNGAAVDSIVAPDSRWMIEKFLKTALEK